MEAEETRLMVQLLQKLSQRDLAGEITEINERKTEVTVAVL